MCPVKFQQTCHKVCRGFLSNCWQTNRIIDNTININYDDNNADSNDDNIDDNIDDNNDDSNDEYNNDNNNDNNYDSNDDNIYDDNDDSHDLTMVDKDTKVINKMIILIKIK